MISHNSERYKLGEPYYKRVGLEEYYSYKHKNPYNFKILGVKVTDKSLFPIINKKYVRGDIFRAVKPNLRMIDSMNLIEFSHSTLNTVDDIEYTNLSLKSGVYYNGVFNEELSFLEEFTKIILNTKPVNHNLIPLDSLNIGTFNKFLNSVHSNSYDYFDRNKAWFYNYCLNDYLNIGMLIHDINKLEFLINENKCVALNSIQTNLTTISYYNFNLDESVASHVNYE